MMSARLAASLAALACGFGPLVIAPEALAAPPGRTNGHDCDVFNANDDAIQGDLDTINGIVAGYYTSWVGNSFFGDEQYGEFDPDDLNTVLHATSTLSSHADGAKKGMQTDGANLALQRLASDSSALHDTVLKVQDGTYRPRQLGLVRDMLDRSMNNYHNAYSFACGGDVVEPQH
ncbi:MAG: hypothetical protein ACRC20_10595 [Segniliparus sp.]|uniref:hypothetical protein n=1 Tax=Segniliparus sp. TaxID=2804064 RepID=UPI003F2E4539